MSILHAWLTANMDIVFFIYGAAFVFFGGAILIYPKNNELYLANIFWLLGMFGVLHGINEWLDMWKIIKGDNALFASLRLLILLSSFMFLFEFGRRLLLSMSQLHKSQWLARILGWPIYGPLLAMIITTAVVSDNPQQSTGVCVRYTFGFLGSLLSGIGFIHYARVVEVDYASNGMPRIFRLSGVAVLCYAVLAGLIVPAGSFFPANIINQEVFHSLTDYPVQLFRTLVAIAMAFLTVRMLSFFNLDIRKSLKKALSETKRLKHQRELILSTAAEGIVELDRAGRIVFANPYAQSALGYSESELVGAFSHELIHHSHPDGSVYPIAQCFVHDATIKGHACEGEDEYFWRKNGTAFPIRYTVRPEMDGDTFIGTVMTFSDITEQKQTESMLRKLSRAIEYSPSMLVITDLDGNIEYVNPKFSEVSGYALDEVRGKNPRLWKSGEQPDAFYQSLWQSIAAGESWHGEFHNRNKQGGFYWDRTSISSIRDEHGNITHFFAVKEDITEHKLIQERLRELTRRVVELQEDERRRISRELHDGINQLLVSVKYKLEMAEVKINQNDINSLADIRRSHELLSVAIQEVRRISHDLRPSVLDDLGLNAALVSLCQEFAEHTGIQVRPTLPDTESIHPQAELETTLYRIAQEAFTNIEKHASATEVALSLVSSDDSLHLVIEDNGRGFDAEHAMQLSGSDTGIGLKNFKERVKLLDGQFFVYSEPGMGTRLDVTLPISEEL